MDTLPVILTAIAREVTHMRVERRVAASQRREPLQRKIGAGLSREEFAAGVATGKIRHVGLRESAAAIAAALRWTIDRIEETIEPMIAAEPILTRYLRVEPGQVAGVHQIARGWEEGHERLQLELKMAVSVPASVDRIEITGDPSLSMTLEGIHGDIATAAIVLNAVPSVAAARPGLLTMADLALVHR
jgi:4-hydroxy-tetrahydrodipicolinate reductase